MSNQTWDFGLFARATEAGASPAVAHALALSVLPEAAPPIKRPHTVHTWVAILAVAAGMCGGMAAGAAITRTAPAVIEEDSPQWDCRTMGNRTCGTGSDTVNGGE